MKTKEQIQEVVEMTDMMISEMLTRVFPDKDHLLISKGIEKLLAENNDISVETVAAVLPKTAPDNDYSTLFSIIQWRGLLKFGKVEDVLNSMEEYLNVNPDNEVVGGGWYALYFYDITGNERFNCDVADFIDKLFNKYTFMLKGDNSIGELKFDYFFNSIPKPEKELFIPVLEKSLKRYPDKVILNLFIARVYKANNDFPMAIEYYSNFISLAERDRKWNDDEKRYIYAGDAVKEEYYIFAHGNISDCFYNMGQLDNAIRISAKVLEIIPEFFSERLKNSNDPGSETLMDDCWKYLYIYAIRLRIFMQLDKKDMFKKEYTMIKDYLELMHEEYTDVVEYYEKLCKKTHDQQSDQ